MQLEVSDTVSFTHTHAVRCSYEYGTLTRLIEWSLWKGKVVPIITEMPLQQQKAPLLYVGAAR